MKGKYDLKWIIRQSDWMNSEELKNHPALGDHEKYMRESAEKYNWDDEILKPPQT